MTRIIRADTDQLRAVARQMRTTADEIMSGANAMHQAMGALDATWSGSARDRGMARWGELVPKYPPAAERLMHFANELEALAQRLDDAAAVFGDGLSLDAIGQTDEKGDQQSDNPSSSADTTIPGYAAPKKMMDLFNITYPNSEEDLKKEQGEIKIFQNSAGEYIITLNGTDPSDFKGINSIPNALLGGAGLGTIYTKKLKEALRSLPGDTKKVHLVGYSLGGITAQNLADEDAFLANNHIELKSITTFGSPRPYGDNVDDKSFKGIPYYQYDQPGDSISLAVLPNSSLRTTDESMLSLNFFKNFVSEGLSGFATHTKSYQNPTSTAGYQMSEENVPFSTDGWKQVRIINDNDVSAMDTFTGVFTEKLPKPVESAVYIYNKATEVADNVIDSTLSAANDGLHAIKDAGSWAFNGMKSLF